MARLSDRVMGTGNPLADLRSALGGARESFNAWGLAKPSSSGLQMKRADEALPDFQMPTEETEETEAPETGTSMDDVSEWLSKPQNFVKATAFSEGLQLAGSIINIKQAEQDAMADLDARFGFKAEQIERNANLKSFVNSVARRQNLEQLLNQIDAMKMTGGMQRQQFIRNPKTGGFI